MADAEQMLRKLINQIVENEGLQEYNVALQPISSGGANYTSQLFVVNVTGDKELRFFAKVAILGEKMREAVPMGVFDNERYFYTKLVKTYEELEDKFNVPEEHKLACPKFYGCNSNYLEETIVLENLVHQGYGDYNRLDSVDWPYAASAVTEMAKLHALSYACKRQNPKEFANIIESLKFEWTITDKLHVTFWGANKKLAIDATDMKNRERVENHLNESIRFSLEDFFRPVDAIVLIHGDYRASNLLHKYNENGTVSVKIVDFQTIQGGCPIADLVYFIISSTDEQFRGHYFQKLVDHYYEELCAALKRLDISPDEVYPRKMFDDELKEKLRFAFDLAVFALPLVTVETKNAPVIDLDSDVSNFVVEKPSDLYAKRLNEIINDCIRWGVL